MEQTIIIILLGLILWAVLACGVDAGRRHREIMNPKPYNPEDDYSPY